MVTLALIVTVALAAGPGPSVDSLDPQMLGFLSLSDGTASLDGGVRIEWTGAGGSQLQLSWDALEKRDERVSEGDMITQSLMQPVRMFYSSGGAVDTDALREKLAGLASEPIDEARESYLAAVGHEQRRLFFVERAVALAAEKGETLPGVSPELVKRRLEALKDGRIAAAVERRISGYRSLALSLVSYLDGDALAALEKMKAAATALPDEPLTHAFLGSFYYLFQQTDSAIAAWKRSLQLDPSNETVKAALKEFGGRGKRP